jgi:hypothetical protein
VRKIYRIAPVDRHDGCQYCELPPAPAWKLTTINALRGFLALPFPAIAKSAPSFSRSKRPMAIAAIHVVPDEGFDDWVVRDDSGYELGHCPTRESAELVGQAIARKLRGQFVVYPPAEQTSRTNFI